MNDQSITCPKCGEEIKLPNRRMPPGKSIRAFDARWVPKAIAPRATNDRLRWPVVSVVTLAEIFIRLLVAAVICVIRHRTIPVVLRKSHLTNPAKEAQSKVLFRGSVCRQYCEFSRHRHGKSGYLDLAQTTLNIGPSANEGH